MPNGNYLDFQFDAIHATGKKKLLVSVYDNGRRITFFYMEKEYPTWRIINAPKVSNEFLQMEQTLDAAIRQQEGKHD
jgi:hypothetical protein